MQDPVFAAFLVVDDELHRDDAAPGHFASGALHRSPSCRADILLWKSRTRLSLIWLHLRPSSCTTGQIAAHRLQNQVDCSLEFPFPQKLLQPMPKVFQCKQFFHMHLKLQEYSKL